MIPANDNPVSPDDPTVVFIGDAASAGLEVAQLDLACRFYGFRLDVVSFRSENDPTLSAATADDPLPIHVVVHASELAGPSATRWRALQTSADRHRIPIAVVGITPNCEEEALAQFVGGFAVHAATAAAGGLWVTATDPASAGFELRGVRLALGR